MTKAQDHSNAITRAQLAEAIGWNVDRLNSYLEHTPLHNKTWIDLDTLAQVQPHLYTLWCYLNQ